MAGQTRERSLVGGSASLVGGRIAVAVLSYAGTAAIARTLSGDDWGGFTFVFSVTTLLGAIFDFQATRLVLKELLDNDDPDSAGRTVGSYTTLRFALGAIAYGVAIAFTMLGGYSVPVQQAMVVGGVFLLLAPTWNGVFLYFQARHWLRSVAVISALSRVLLLAFTLALVAGGTDSLVLFIWPSLLAEAFILVCLVAIARRHIRIRPVIEPRRWLAWLKETLPIVLGAAIGTVYFRLDAVMLSQLDDLRAVGLYGIAYKFSDLLAFLPAAIMAPTFTLLVGAWPGDVEHFWRNFRGALVLLVLAAFSLTAAFCVFAAPLISVLYGDRYEPATGAARLVVIGQALRFFTVLCTFTLVAVRRNVAYAVASVAGLGLNVVLNLVLIPRYSYGGAAFATVVTELAVLAILVGTVRTIPQAPRFPWGVVARIGVAAAALVAVAVPAQLVMPWPVAAVLGGVTLLGLLHVLGIDGPGGLRAVPHLLEPLPATTPAAAASPLDAPPVTS